MQNKITIQILDRSPRNLRDSMTAGHLPTVVIMILLATLKKKRHKAYQINVLFQLIFNMIMERLKNWEGAVKNVSSAESVRTIFDLCRLKKYLLFLIILITTNPDVNAVIISPTDSNIQYMGRWDHSIPSAPTMAWSGGAITVNFNGTGIKATLDGDNGPDNRSETFRTVIDDDYSTTHTFSVSGYGSGAEYTLASGLTSDVHKLVIMKETYDDWGHSAVFYGFDVTGTGLVAPPANPSFKLDVYGDSNAAGSNIGSENNSSGTGQYFSFPFIAGRALGAQVHNQSVGGETISGSHSRYTRYGWWDTDPEWDFNLYTPDVVVVELGANDVSSPQSSMIADHNAFLDDLRSTYPSAHICLFNGYGWDFNEPANYTADLVASRGDPNMSSVIHPWVFGQWHGAEYEHAGMARYLVEHLENVLGITAPNAIDVMDGFGRDGDVANGSFEAVAPFGGYGWRFFLDSRVNRVYDPIGAKNGNYYLSLSNGAPSFHTIPAVSSEGITVTVWMRGAIGGDNVDITIDFRDQSMGGRNSGFTPIAPYTETKTLTVDWVQYSITAIAPATGNPIFGSRITFTADSGNTVYIDDIKRIPTEPTPTPTVPVTPTSTPSDFVVNINTSREMYQEGDMFRLTTEIFNPFNALIVEEYIILDVYGAYFFYPGWTESVDSEWWGLPTQMFNQTILEFIWPEVAGQANELTFWIGLVEPGTVNILGSVDHARFGYY